MKIAQKDPSRFMPMEDRHDLARKHQMIFARLMQSDEKLVAAREIQVLEGLEARLYQKLCDVIDILRKVADRLPLA